TRVGEGSKAAWRMREGTAAVEQPRERVGEECPAGGGSRNDVRFCEELARDDVEQILRETPQRRGVQDQLVGIEIQTAVKPIAVVEVPVAHQDLELLKRIE